MLGMHPKNRKAMAARGAQAADAALREKGYVAPIDVMLGIGWLQPNHVIEWRTRRLPFLERGIQANLSKISEAMRLFAGWARQSGLRPSTTEYVARTAARARGSVSSRNSRRRRAVDAPRARRQQAERCHRALEPDPEGLREDRSARRACGARRCASQHGR